MQIVNRKHIIRNLRARGIEFDHNLSTAELNDLLNQSGIVNKISTVTNFTNGRGNIKVSYNAAKADEPVQVMVCEDIGKDAWSGEGFCLKDLQTSLDGVDKNRALDFLIDSPGGYVNAGKSIRNWLSNWGGVINQTIIGVAASTASWCIPADTTRAYKNSQVFMHRAMAAPFGNVDDLQEAITQLNKTDGQIADMYAEQSESDPAEMLDLMKGANGQGTLLTGQEALAAGLVDELIDGEAKNNFSTEWLNSARQKLSALNSLQTANGRPQGPQPTQGDRNKNNNQNQNTMNLQQLIALLNKRGITPPANCTIDQANSLIAASDAMRAQNKTILTAWNVAIPDDATDEAIVKLISNGKPAAVTPPAGLSAEDRVLMDGMKNQLANARRKEIREAINKGASEGRITATEIENWESDAFDAVDHPTNGNPVLNRLNKLEPKTPGVPAIPESVNKLSVENSDIKEITRGFEAHNQAVESWKRGNEVPMKDISNQSIEKNRFFKKFKNRFLQILNTNTIDAGLQRQLILQDVVIRDFAKRILSIDLFGTVFKNVPLQGTDKVEVPYFDLDSQVPVAFAGSYAAALKDTASGVREITVGWGKAHDGDFGVGHNRAVMGLSLSSHELSTQPYLKSAQLAALRAEAVAFKVFQDILSVVKVANFPNLLAAGNKITKSFDQFSSDDFADLKVMCKAWPMAGRGLLLDSAYDGNAMKDPTFKSAYQQALDSVKAQGKLMPEMYGFNYTENPNIPDNGINLRGLAFWKYAILAAFAPVPPVEEVRRSGTVYELLTDSDSGIPLEFRSFGSNDADTGNYFTESNYGFAPGLKTAIKAIVTP